MKLFLDTSVLLAAAGSATGASRCLFSLHKANQWRLLTTTYCLEEAQRNIRRFGPTASTFFEQYLEPQISLTPTRLSLDRALIFLKTKDRPVLLSALGARADYLLTLDIADFQQTLGPQIYGMGIRRPGVFLSEQRQAGTLREV